MSKQLFFLLLFYCSYSFGQSPQKRSVQVSAVVQETPPTLFFSWPADPEAETYTVYKKLPEADDWGAALTTLPGSANTFTDTNVAVGEVFEYAFFKKEFEGYGQIVCLPSGTPLTFTMSDMYGIGLCCNFGFGFYELTACGEIIANGDDFGFEAIHDFTLCDNGNSCEDITISIKPDMFPNSTSWKITHQQTGEVLAASGEVGDFLTERSEYGYILAGIRAPAIEYKGQILLLVEEAINATLSEELNRLEFDLVREGWQPQRLTVNINQSATQIREQIQNIYNTFPDLNTLFIIGHVPVPYSGNMYPDTHSENHQGAWSADAYYGELDGEWTDETVNITTAFFERNHNIPGDGKFDQTAIPGEMELAVGRIDFHDMPAFSKNEIELTRQYLNKNHSFRNGEIVVQRRALIDDNFDDAFAAPAASGWRNFATMFGADQIVEGDYFSTLSNEGYLWSYGCGSGSHISASGIGETADFANDSLLTVFTMLFGSQFGDWDNVNNFLKAPLASGITLTNCWTGNPPWTFHHMAMGFTIGESTVLTQNKGSLYLNNSQLVHVALMGDPTLKMHIVKAPENITAMSNGSDVQLSWEAPQEDAIIGYYIYRKPPSSGNYERIHTDPITETTFSDIPPDNGLYSYMVRTLKLETSGSGTYHNLSPGTLVTSDFILSDKKTEKEKLEVVVFPNPVVHQLNLIIEGYDAYDSRLNLYSTLGKLQGVHDLPRGQSRHFVSVLNLNTGIYFYEITNKNQVIISGRFIIQK